MRMRRRTAVVLALAAAALAVAGIALAAADGNVSKVEFKFSPNKVPKKKFQKGALFVHPSTTFTDPGNAPAGGLTDRVQLWFDDDFKINPSAAPKCNPASIQGNIPMSQAMSQCGSAKIGKGSAQAYNSANPSHPIPACVLVFNGKPQGGHPTVLLFTRAQVGGTNPTIDCSDPAHNNNGNVSTLLTGLLKNASGDFGRQLDVNHIVAATQPLALTSFQATLKRGKYVSGRCHDGNHKWNVKGKHTYSDGQSTTQHVSQRCKVRH